MKTTFGISCLAFLVLITSNRSFGMMSIESVSKARAKELGMEVRTLQAGPDTVRVELEFKTEGALKSFERVDLEIMADGKMVLSTALKEEKAAPGHVVVSLAAARTHLDGMTLRVVTGVPRDYTGHDLRLRDFVESEKPVGAASSEEQQRFVATARKAFEARDSAQMDAMTYWDGVPEDRKKNLRHSYASLVAEKDVLFDFKLVDPDGKAADRELKEDGITYRFNLPVTRELQLKAIDTRDKKTLFLLTFAVGEKDGKLYLLGTVPVK
jgi:hypothetical protein